MRGSWYGECMAALEDEETTLLERISVDPTILGGKPIIRGRRFAVEHVLGVLAAGDDADTILAGYSWLEKEDIRACLIYAHRVISHQRADLGLSESNP